MPDVRCDWLSVEVKLRRHLPEWLETAMLQAVAASGVSQLPIVVLHERGQRHDGDLVMLRLGDFCDWFGGLNGRAVVSDMAGGSDEALEMVAE